MTSGPVTLRNGEVSAGWTPDKVTSGLDAYKVRGRPVTRECLRAKDLEQVSGGPDTIEEQLNRKALTPLLAEGVAEVVGGAVRLLSAWSAMLGRSSSSSLLLGNIQCDLHSCGAEWSCGVSVSVADAGALPRAGSTHSSGSSRSRAGNKGRQRARAVRRAVEGGGYTRRSHRVRAPPGVRGPQPIRPRAIPKGDNRCPTACHPSPTRSCAPPPH